LADCVFQTWNLLFILFYSAVQYVQKWEYCQAVPEALSSKTAQHSVAGSEKHTAQPTAVAEGIQTTLNRMKTDTDNGRSNVNTNMSTPTCQH
jgi:hypothetical protein